MGSTTSSHDPAGMLQLLAQAGRDIADGRHLGEAVAISDGPSCSEVILAGMGGSAIAGDLVAATIAGRTDARVRVRVVRGYEIAPPPSRGALVILSSYSGNTAETLSVMDRLDVARPPLVITSGGRLLARAQSERWPVIQLPGGRPPRTALYLAWSALLAALSRNGLLPDMTSDLAEAESVAGETACANAPLAPAGAPARLVAAFLAPSRPDELSMPLFIATSPMTEAVAVRWRGEFNENTKLPSLVSALPEMHHNDIVGLAHTPQVAPFRAVILRDEEEHPEVTRRVEITRTLLKEVAIPAMDARGRGAGRLARLVSLALLGDHASVYLALERGIDPTPVEIIDRIKTSLADISPAAKSL
jgi:glucose/mannose-6-phosphate isomerase